MIQKSQTLQVVQADCGEHTICIDQSHVTDVVSASRMQRSDTMTTARVGTVAVDHAVHGVYSLSQQLGQTRVLPTTGTEEVVVLKSSLGLLALLVDRVRPSRDLNISRVVPVPPILQFAPHNVCEAIVFFAGEGSPQSVSDGKATTASIQLMLSVDLLHARVEGRLGGSQRKPCAAALRRENSTSSLSNPELGTELGKRRASLVMFSIGGQTLALSVTQVVEISQLSSWLPVPAAPNHVMGLLNWRDQPAVVVDLEAILGLPAILNAADTRLLVARVNSGEADLVAFPIDSGAKVVPVPIKSQAGHAPAGCRSDLLCGSYDIEGQNLLIPDMPRVLADLNTV